jgi:hypothetical protein
MTPPLTKEQEKALHHLYYDEKLDKISKIIRPSIKQGIGGYSILWNDGDKTFEPRENLLEDVPKLIKHFNDKYDVIWNLSGYTWNVKKWQQDNEEKKEKSATARAIKKVRKFINNQ